jgi:hypothetical protein
LLRSRIALIVAFILIALLGALSYAGTGVGAVVYHLLFDGATLIVWLLAAAGIGGFLLSFIAPSDRTNPLLGFVSAVAAGLGTISLLTLLLGLAGLLHHSTALAIIVVGILLALLQLIRAKSNLADVGAWLRAPAGWNWLWLLVAPFAAIAIVAAMLPPGFLWRRGDPFFYDVVEYHLQVPREWFEASRIMPLSHNVFSFFPMNVEMHYLLAMHLSGGPWTGMYLAQLMHFAFIALFVAAVYAFALQIAQPLPAITGALAVATVPWLTQLAAVAYDEGGFLLFGALAIAWVWLAVVEEGPSTRRLIIAGAMAGFACGTKLTAVPEVLVALTIAIGALLLWTRNRSQKFRNATPSPGTPGEGRGEGDFERQRARRSKSPSPQPSPGVPGEGGNNATAFRRADWWMAIRCALIFAGAGLLTFSPWLVRNERWAGNPIFPEATRFLGPGNFTPVQIERWNRAHSARPDQQHLSARLHAGATEILESWQYGYFLIPLALLGVFLTWRRRLTILLAGMLLATALFWLFATHLQGRFFVLALPLCGWLIAQIDRPALCSCTLVVVLIAAGMSGARLHHDIVSILHGGVDSPFPQPMVSLLGLPDISGVEAGFLDGLNPGQDVVLIGDAKAFFYTIPMSQLHYRTVFDVHGSDGDFMSAWNGGPIPDGARVIVDPPELERFHETYWKIPEMPAWMVRDAPKDQIGRPLPYIVAGPHR